MNALDLSDELNSQNIKIDELVALKLEDFEKLGIPSERAHQLHSDIKNRIESLQCQLKIVDCEEILGDLLKIGCNLEDVFSLDDDILQTTGISYTARKAVLRKIQNVKKEQEEVKNKLEQEKKTKIKGILL